MSQSKKVKIRWRRIATIFIAAYLIYWTGVSVHHMIAIGQQDAVLTQKISSVRAQNRVLSHDISALHNSTTLKQILAGDTPLPTANTAP